MAYPVTLLGTPKFCVMDTDGDPMSGGKVYTYAPTTTTPQLTYSDKACTIPNTNPVILDSRGEAIIYLDRPTKVVLKTPADVLVWTEDNVGDELDAYITAKALATKAGVQASSYSYGVSSNATDAYSVTLAPAPATLTNGMMVVLMPDVTNTGACTLTVNDLALSGAKDIKKLVGGAAVACATGDILVGYPVPLFYSEVLDHWAMANFSPSSAWPVGSIFTSIVATNPATLLGFGTWTAFGTGKMLVGINAADADFDTVEETGGQKVSGTLSHVHTVAAHTHTTPALTHSDLVHSVTTETDHADGGAKTSVIGVSNHASIPSHGADVTGGTALTSDGELTTVSVMNPYIVVYFWKRVS